MRMILSVMRMIVNCRVGRVLVVSRFRVPEDGGRGVPRRPGARRRRRWPSGPGYVVGPDRAQRRRPRRCGAGHHVGERRRLPPRALVVRREAARGAAAEPGDRRAERLRGWSSREPTSMSSRRPVVRLSPSHDRQPAGRTATGSDHRGQAAPVRPSTTSSPSPSAGVSSTRAARSTAAPARPGTTARSAWSSRRTSSASGGSPWCRCATTWSASTPRSSCRARPGRPAATSTRSPTR